MATITEDKIITQTQSLNYILHHVVILEFYQLFPDEGIVLTEKDEAGILAAGENILDKNGFHLPVDLMINIAEIQELKAVEEHGFFI